MEKVMLDEVLKCEEVQGSNRGRRGHSKQGNILEQQCRGGGGYTSELWWKKICGIVIRQSRGIQSEMFYFRATEFKVIK